MKIRPSSLYLGRHWQWSRICNHKYLIKVILAKFCQTRSLSLQVYHKMVGRRTLEVCSNGVLLCGSSHPHCNEDWIPQWLLLAVVYSCHMVYRFCPHPLFPSLPPHYCYKIVKSRAVVEAGQVAWVAVMEVLTPVGKFLDRLSEWLLTDASW